MRGRERRGGRGKDGREEKGRGRTTFRNRNPSQIPGNATAANSVKIDKYLKRRVALCWSEDNRSLQANKVVVVTYK